ncbi:cell wall metabolism sensor histidine kinase WalK [Halobacillus sp. Marseille-P3879]|uniref:sensor histidine kinase n=1 Tax=Halobacillus sp. Marseille-P3879 TaxID=2045014 RepID=UPI000C7C5C6A|nr:HAMP domain-containing sensor histidine kinase [Halobacillus sp. Marseille-P3879]
MSIRKRLLLSNLGMIVLPIIALLIMEILLGLLMFRVFHLDVESRIETFTQIRFIGIILILILTNGLLTYYVARTIIKPVRELSDAAGRIADGELDFQVKPERRDELGELAESFETMRRKLQEAEELQYKYEESRKELIASISHDLKTPITSIKGYVEGIVDGVADTPEKLQRYATIVYKKADEMDHLIDELFLYSKLDVQRVPFHFEKVDLYAYFEDYLEDVKLDTDVEVELRPQGKRSFFVAADREQLNRVVTNLIKNSLKHMDKEDKLLKVTLKEYGGRIEVTIQDNGEGIPKAHLPHIFEQFYRADAARGKADGSGLGLAIVKKIVEEHGGDVAADSEEGKGATISFTLEKWKEEEDGADLSH